VITPEQSRDSVRIVDAEKKSAKLGKTVRVGSSKVLKFESSKVREFEKA
jgi:hypothetical protein